MILGSFKQLSNCSSSTQIVIRALQHFHERSEPIYKCINVNLKCVLYSRCKWPEEASALMVCVVLVFRHFWICDKYLATLITIFFY